MIKDGIVTMIPTEAAAVEMVDAICEFYNVRYMMAFNSGFDFVKTVCLKQNRPQ